MRFTHILADLLASGQTVRFTAPGHSMHPVIRNGDVLLVTPLERTARPGDILLYRDAGGRPVAHRLIGFAAEDDSLSLVLKGDSAAAPDLPVRPAQVLGRVSALERDGRLIDPYGVQSPARAPSVRRAFAHQEPAAVAPLARIKPAASTGTASRALIANSASSPYSLSQRRTPGTILK